MDLCILIQIQGLETLPRFSVGGSPDCTHDSTVFLYLVLVSKSYQVKASVFREPVCSHEAQLLPTRSRLHFLSPLAYSSGLAPHICAQFSYGFFISLKLEEYFPDFIIMEI